MEILLTIIIGSLTTLVGVGQLLAEYKYYDKRTTHGRGIRKFLIVAVILLGIFSFILSAVVGHNQKSMSADMAVMRKLIEMRPRFEVFINGQRIDSNSALRVKQSGGIYPLKMSFVNLGDKSATGVLIQMIGALDYSRVNPPWQVGEMASPGEILERRKFGSISYSLGSPVQRDVYIDLPPLYYNPENTGAVGIAIKSTENPVSMWSVDVIPE